MDTDIRDELDRSFGYGPPLDHVDDIVELGHRAVRRRRLALAGLAAGCCLAAAGVAWSVVDSPGASSGRDVTVQPTQAPSATESPAVAGDPPVEYVDADHPGLGGADVAYDDGVLLVREGVEILEQVANPLDRRPPRTSLGLALAVDGAQQWALVAGSPSGSTVSTVPARQSFPDLQTWLDDQVALDRGEPTLALVSFGTGAELVAEPGVEIVQQQPSPQVGAEFAGPDAVHTAVAEVRWQGERWFVLARELPGSAPEYFPTAASVSAPTLAGFLEFARAAYSGGAGLR